MNDAVSAKEPASKLRPVLWGLLLVVVVVAALWGAKQLGIQERLREVLEWIREQGAAAPAIFIGVYAASTVLLIPGSLLTLGAGLLFGVVLGTVYVSVASVMGATFAFLIGRYLARGWVAKKINAYPRFKAVDEAVGEEGWKIVALTRLSPAFPFVFLNYAFGLTRVSLAGYFLASWICMLPGTLMYVYFGSLAGDLATLGTETRQKSPMEWTLVVIGLIATVVVTVYITKVARRALARRVAG